MERVRVGVIGTSWFSDQVHLPALKSHSRAELAAICGRNRERAEEMARKYAIPEVYSDYRDMFEKAHLDAAVVVVPDDLHYQMTMDALDAGLHVVCEKPLALNARQAREMYEKAEARHLKHMTYFTWRWMPHARYIRDLLDQGYIGRCLHGEFHFLMNDTRERSFDWKLDQRRTNGQVGDLGSHMIDLARWYVGDIARVSALLSAPIRRTGPDEREVAPASQAAHLIVEFANGAVGTIQVSGVACVGNRFFEQGYRLIGEAGTLEVDYPMIEGASVWGARVAEGQGAALAIPGKYFEGMDPSTRSGPALATAFLCQSIGDRLFIDSIVEDRSVSPSLYDGWQVQEVVDAAIRSHREGRWITVGEATDRPGSGL